MGLVKLEIIGISAGAGLRPPAVILQSANTATAMIIVIGPNEALAIAREIEAQPSPRPMTHDLFEACLDMLGVTVLNLQITDLKENTFFATLTLLTADGRKVAMDCRPSDGMVIAIKSKADILIERELLELVGLEMQVDDDELTEADIDQLVTDFKEFIQDINPDDFKD